MKAHTLFLIFVMFPMVVRAQLAAGYENASFSAAAVARPASSFALSANPANLKTGSIQWYGVRHFGLRELQETGVSSGVHFDRFDTGFEVHYLGFDLFRETTFLTGGSTQLGKTSLGLAKGFKYVSVPGYGKAFSGFLNAGFRHSISENTFVVGGVSGIDLYRNGDFLSESASWMYAGTGYMIQDRILLMLSVVQPKGFEREFAGGIEGQILDSIRFGGGFHTGTRQWSMGLNVNAGKMGAGFMARHHPVLGWSHGMGFNINWK